MADDSDQNPRGEGLEGPLIVPDTQESQLHSQAGLVEPAGFEIVLQGPWCATCGDARIVSRRDYPNAKPAPGHFEFVGQVRSDDDYAKAASAEAVVALLRNDWHARVKGPTSLVYDRDGCWVEIELGNGEPANEVSGTVRWVGFRVPAAASFKSGSVAYYMSMAVAQTLGWRLFDPQRDDYVDPSELEPGPSLREGLTRLALEVRAVGRRDCLRKAARRLTQQSMLGLLLPIVLGFGAATAIGWLFRFSIETYPRLFVSLTLSVAAGLVVLDAVSDVLGEIHQEAVRARKARA